jgi:hypothetical protein
VHANFDRITKGSAMLKFRVSENSTPLLEARVKTAPTLDAGNAARRGFDRIEQLLRADGTSAEFLPAGKGAAILKFPGATGPRSRSASIREFGELHCRSWNGIPVFRSPTVFSAPSRLCGSNGFF